MTLTQNPLISVVLPTKNSLPHLKKGVEVLQKQSYRNFELIIQDGGSTDGTLEYLADLKGVPKLDIQSEPDTGIGQAYGRAMKRCQGELLCFTASDECLLQHSLEMGVNWFKKQPDAVTIFGGTSIVDQERNEIRRFIPGAFDFIKLMTCEYPPIFAGLFNRKIIESDCFYDESLKTCPDYDFWMRLGSKFSNDRFVNYSEIFTTALGDRTSMSFRCESFKQFCKDKQFILKRFMRQKKQDPTLVKLKVRAQEGIYNWAARECLVLEGGVKLAKEFSKKEQEFYQKSLPRRCSLQATNKDMTLEVLQTNSKKTCVYPLQGNGGDQSWGYFYRFHFEDLPIADDSCYWIEIKFKVTSGAIGVCLMEGEEINKEKVCLQENKKVTLLFSLKELTHPSLIIRNGGIPFSELTIYEIAILENKKRISWLPRFWKN